jgi:beta-lactamase class A
LLTTIKAILLLAAFCTQSCSTVGEKAKNGLVGRWQWADSQHTAEYVFLENGNFTGYVTGNGALLSKFTGRWLLRQGVIFYEYTGDKMGRIRAGTRDRDKVRDIAHDYFVIEAADGSVRKYVRVSGG